MGVMINYDVGVTSVWLMNAEGVKALSHFAASEKQEINIAKIRGFKVADYLLKLIGWTIFITLSPLLRGFRLPLSMTGERQVPQLMRELPSMRL